MSVSPTSLDFTQGGRRNGRPVYRPAEPASRRSSSMFEITEQDIRELNAFVRYLFRTPRQSVERAEERRRLVSDLGGGNRVATIEPYQFSRSRITRSDFGSYLARLQEATTRWFEGGEIIAPVLAERVQLFLHRSGRLKWERAFLAIFCFHFAGGYGGRNDGLVARATELGAYPLLRRASAHRLPAPRGDSSSTRPAAYR